MLTFDTRCRDISSHFLVNDGMPDMSRHFVQRLQLCKPVNRPKIKRQLLETMDCILLLRNANNFFQPGGNWMYTYKKVLPIGVSICGVCGHLFSRRANFRHQFSMRHVELQIHIWFRVPVNASRYSTPLASLNRLDASWTALMQVDVIPLPLWPFIICLYTTSNKLVLFTYTIIE